MALDRTSFIGYHPVSPHRYPRIDLSHKHLCGSTARSCLQNYHGSRYVFNKKHQVWVTSRVSFGHVAPISRAIIDRSMHSIACDVPAYISESLSRAWASLLRFSPPYTELN